MDAFSALNTQATSSFSQEQSKVGQLQKKLEGRENRKDLLKTAQQFESVFFKQLLTQMDKTVDRSSGILSGGSGEEMFRGMLFDKISDNISSRPGGSGFGLAEAIYRQFESQVPQETEGEDKP